MYAAHRASQSSKASSVVPIGGAPFVSPIATVRRRQSSASTSEASSGGESSASSSPVTESGNGVWQAAVRYSSAMQEHTRKMWENERLNIERARLGLSAHDGDQRRGSQSSGATSTSASSTGGGRGSEEYKGQHDSSLTKRNTISGSVDALFRGRKRHVKSTSVI